MITAGRTTVIIPVNPRDEKRRPSPGSPALTDRIMTGH